MRHGNTLTKTLAATAGCAAAAAALCASTPANAVPTATTAAVLPSTSIGPAGDNFSAQLFGGLTVNVGGIVGSCTLSAAAGTIPVAPGNSNPSGPVTVSLGSPVAQNCSANLGIAKLSFATSGNWTMSFQNGSPIVGTLTIPQNGAVATVSGLVNCTITTATNGPASLNGTWSNGTNSTSSPSTLSITNAQLPVQVSGSGGAGSSNLGSSLSSGGSSGCPGAGTLSLTATYNVLDTSNPALPVTVGA
ncbi:hypothetical protein [Nocardia stercoris]|uniref:Ig-like domain-containing protein n=1 Tax=Nocardia stercoris TaxID=2483361 RepID=A0A3M2LDG1_9NOCA|nr:hypothetical protein [Nocardia stercoris]RMI35551.1 hypothetical protein EBN03_04740 [Nocardia stercoris]